MQITRKTDVEKVEVMKGVTRYILLSGEKLMVVYYEIEPGVIFPEHSHPHEQMGYIIKGKAEYKAGGKVKIAEAGAAYYFPSNEKHQITTLDEKSVFLDIFSPPREDFLVKKK